MFISYYGYFLVFIGAVKWTYIVLNAKDACLYHIMEYFLVFNLLGLGIQYPFIRTLRYTDATVHGRYGT